MRSILAYPRKLFAIIVLCFFGLNALFLLVSGAAFYATYTDLAYREIKEAKTELLQASSHQLSSYVKGIQDTAVFIVTNDMVQDHLTTRPESFFDFHFRSKEIYDYLLRMQSVKEGIHSIELYTDQYEGYTPVQDNFLYSYAEAQRQGWLPGLAEADGFWNRAREGAGGSGRPPMVSYVHRVMGDGGQTLGVIKINIPVRELFRALSQAYPADDSDDYYILMDTRGEYIASTLPEGEAVRYGAASAVDPERVAEALRASTKEAGSVDIAGRTYSVVHADGGTGNWKLTQLLARDVFVGSREEVQRLTIVLLSVLIVVSIPVVFWISRKLTSPIGDIVGAMHTVEKGDFSVRIQGSSIYEYQYLTSQFNRMVSRLKELMWQVNKEHTDRREAEMRLLQAQIKPHFLYNTLDMIHWRALDYNARDISQMVHQLSKLFRIGLSNDKWYVAVKDEFVHADCYMTIQKYRQQFPIRYTENVQRELYGCLIPKIVLQPFLENAVIHGFRGRKEEAAIEVTAERAAYDNEEMLVIRIRDDGVGLPDGFDVRTAKGIGIRNVIQRIRLYCGPQYGVAVRPAPNGGAEAEIRLPLVRDEEEIERLRRSLWHEDDTAGG